MGKNAGSRSILGNIAVAEESEAQIREKPYGHCHHFAAIVLSCHRQ